MNKNESEKITIQKSIELFDNFLRSVPENKIKFDEFSMLEEITNAKINDNLMKNFLAEKNKKINEKEIKTLKDI